MVTTQSRPFPESLLNECDQFKTNYFKSITVPHIRLKSALNILLMNILEPDDTLVFFVFGVTGVGKTTLRLRFQKLLLEKFLPYLQNNPGQIAVAGIEAIPAERGNFSYKDYYIRALEALNEVLIEYKVDYGLPLLESNNPELPNQVHRKDAPALRRAMEKVFRFRQIKAFTVDEAQHLLMMAGGHQMLHQINWIKSIANLTSTVHILFGTYELLNCPTLNGQVGRRSEDIHFSRYYPDVPEDVAEFIRVIRTFQRHVPLRIEPNFEPHYEYLLSGSVGCVGLLKNWITRSLRVAFAEEAHTLSAKHLQQGAFSPDRINKIREEAEQGERLLQNESNFSGRQHIKKLDIGREVISSSSKKSPVGQRKAKRDSVGINQDEN